MTGHPSAPIAPRLAGPPACRRAELAAFPANMSLPGGCSSSFCSLALALATLLLLQPVINRSEPELGFSASPSLADLAAPCKSAMLSMSRTASPSCTSAASDTIPQLARQGELEICFSDQLQRLSGIPGCSPPARQLGEALCRAEGQPGAAPGRSAAAQRRPRYSQHSATAVAKQFKQQQVPISCVGIGKLPPGLDTRSALPSPLYGVPRS